MLMLVNFGVFLWLVFFFALTTCLCPSLALSLALSLSLSLSACVSVHLFNYQNLSTFTHKNRIHIEGGLVVFCLFWVAEGQAGA